ncbi:flagellar brake protein [Hafnia psychrotolerans]|uniref:Flagellar brake protein YcgR n=1 Tax=Hafnia psychrotolerans TaxID=1477018 RepID=A0ABQ1GUB1_9GAMM|nr:flagellar brake protein [Hafnia psychrotolerans]GGA50560.1 flagellar brake protein YcgR [Hafnia psychrotolerans]
MSEISKEQFIRRNKLGILAVLRDLKKKGTLVMVAHERGQFISKILDVLPDTNQLLFDLGSGDYDNQLAKQAQTLNFVAEPAGAKVEFTSGQVHQITWQDLPTFSCEIPPELKFIQRREYFRVNIPLQPTYICSGKFPDASDFTFKLKDISLGGLGLHVDKVMPLCIESGAVIKDTVVELAEFGSFRLDLEFISVMDRKTVSNKGETVTSQRLSFKFPYLSPAQERDLQRAIFELEKQQNQKAKRFQDD